MSKVNRNIRSKRKSGSCDRALIAGSEYLRLVSVAHVKEIIHIMETITSWFGE